MENQFLRREEPKALDEFELLGDDVLGDRENPFAEWVINYVLEEDDQPVAEIERAAHEAWIDLDDAMDQFRRSSSSQSGLRQLHSCDPIYDDDSTLPMGMTMMVMGAVTMEEKLELVNKLKKAIAL